MPHIARHIVSLLLLGLVLAVPAACSDSSADAWSEMPSGVSRFMNEYFPGRAMADVTRGSDGSYIVTVNDGPVITFNSAQTWLSIDGRGEALPSQFLFDCLPPALYSYIQGLDCVDSVYGVWRNDTQYGLTLPDTAVTYTIASGEISSL